MDIKFDVLNIDNNSTELIHHRLRGFRYEINSDKLSYWSDAIKEYKKRLGYKAFLPSHSELKRVEEHY